MVPREREMAMREIVLPVVFDLMRRDATMGIVVLGP